MMLYLSGWIPTRINIVCLPSLLCNCDPNTSICWIAILNCFITADIETQERKHAFSQTLKRGSSEAIFLSVFT